MERILQRFEMIKNAIMLEDEEIIELQILKLSQLTLDHEAGDIVTRLKSGSFEEVISLIEIYRQSKRGLTNYEDKAVYGLRFELKQLETEYEDLSLERINLESRLNDFNNQYHFQCGDLIESILLYRLQLQQKISQENPHDEAKAEAFEEGRRDYEEYRQVHSVKKDEPHIELSDDDQKALKRAYRRASKLCHPDKVSDEFKEQAAEVFKKLSEAYQSKDLQTVKNILESLENQKGFSVFSDTVTNAERLRQRISAIKRKITEIKISIANIKSDETYQIIENISNWGDYFDEMEGSLREELNNLEKASTVT